VSYGMSLRVFDALPVSRLTRCYIPWREAAPVAVGGNNAGHGRQRDGACAA
jgi:hypothetical protein